ncbi:hypothetical protein [Bacilliculturomica massiliensis]|uniref:hypothetical protein n=1 Tax=Bacilliculturomica massiliensis TaxID=1917867 RepID=UPI00102FAB4E|nr:hypothetical protein [Bacilliculturomica massiliensis]
MSDARGQRCLHYTYDALNRVVQAHENYGNKTRTYEYDTAGNLIYERGDNGSHYVDYQYNVLNQLVRKQVDKDKNVYTYEYDGRGNQVKELYGKNKKVTATGTYVYDETNKLTQGTNGAGEISLYTRDGMGNLVGNEWSVRKNAYGYHGFDDLEPSVPTTLKNHEVVKKDFVLDYTSELANVLLETEEEGLTYRYGYGMNEHRLSVKVSPIEQAAGAIMENGAVKLYYHTDFLCKILRAV